MASTLSKVGGSTKGGWNTPTQWEEAKAGRDKATPLLSIHQLVERIPFRMSQTPSIPRTVGRNTRWVTVVAHTVQPCLIVWDRIEVGAKFGADSIPEGR